jgi:hypothetical protein
MTVVNAEKALELLKLAIEERGEDFVYRPPSSDLSCSYLSEDQTEPGCLVGLALHKNGVSMDTLRSMDRYGMILGAASLVPANECRFTQHGIETLWRAQSRQDNQESWGAAYIAAKSYVENLGDVDG